MPETKNGGMTQQELDALREREREVRKRERDALVTASGVDQPELARLKLLAALIGESVCEQLEGTFEFGAPSGADRRSDRSDSSSSRRDRNSDEQRGIRRI